MTILVVNGDAGAQTSRDSGIPTCVVDDRGRLALPRSSERCAIREEDRRFTTSVAIGMEPTLGPATFSLENDLDGDGQTTGVGESLSSETVMPNYTELDLDFEDKRKPVKEPHVVLETCRSRRGDLSAGLVLHVTRSGPSTTLTSTLWHDANSDGKRGEGETVAELTAPSSANSRTLRTGVCACSSELL